MTSYLKLRETANAGLEFTDFQEDRKNISENKQTTNLQTAWNILNLTQGIGSLGIPYAISVGGLVTIPHIIMVGVITNYTSALIIDLLYEEVEDEESGFVFRKKVRFEFAQIGRDSFEIHGWRIVSAIQVFHLFGASVLYLLLVHKFIELLYSNYFRSQSLCIMATGFLTAPTALVSDMSQLSWLSFTALCLIDVVLVVFSAVSLINFDEWKFDVPFFNASGFTVANSIILFSFVAHPYLPKIESGMREKRDFRNVSMTSFFVATFIKIIFGVLAVLHYGDDIKQTLSDNIEKIEMKLCVTCLLGLNGYFSFAMPTSIIMKIIKGSERNFFEKFLQISPTNVDYVWQKKIIDIILRFLLIAVVTLVAVIVPAFSSLMAIFGSITAVLITLIIPIYCYNILKEDCWKLHNIALILYAIVSAVFGLTTSTINLMEAIKGNET